MKPQDIPSESSVRIESPAFWPAILREIRESPQLLRGILLVAAAGIALHWTATSLEHFLVELLFENHLKLGLLAFGLGSGLLACLLALAVWHYRHTFRELRNRVFIRSEHNPKACLIFFVSPQTLLADTDCPDTGPVTLRHESEFVIQGESSFTDAKAIATAKLPWSWEMLLRGLTPHLSAPLERVWLIGSDNAPGTGSSTKGTFALTPLCQKFLQRYLPPGCVRVWPSPVDFEEIEKLVLVLKQVIARELQDGRRHEDICIDITGGQKPTSVAGAIVTLNNTVTNQYVQTKGEKNPFTYDLSFHSPVDAAH